MQFQILGHTIDVVDFEGSVTAPYIAGELARDCYGLARIPFVANDVVIDVGANIGLFSIVVAKLHPEVTIHAFEPLAVSYRHLVENLKRNQVGNVTAHHLAVTGDGRRVDIAAPNTMSGGASLYYAGDASLVHRSQVESWTLRKVYEVCAPAGARLLKIDAEGAEFEILPAGLDCLARTDYLSAEFHRAHERPDCTVERLIDVCQRHIPPARSVIEVF
ncbi:FkbM family methyltransferase [Sorangium sp. So ce426]|uniref:FkbM family methyltransferase n=1 Tax=Sorangium sp. So ce426 TaxID=3133312 RepID=UPI003F5C2D82